MPPKEYSLNTAPPRAESEGKMSFETWKIAMNEIKELSLEETGLACEAWNASRAESKAEIALNDTYMKGFSDGQRKLFEIIHEVSYKCKTAAEMVFRLGELHGEFVRAETQKESEL